MKNIYLSLGFDTERPYGEWAESKKGSDIRKKQINSVKNIIKTLDTEGVPRTFFILGHYLEKCLDDFSQETLKEIYNKDNPFNEVQQHTYSHLIFRRIKGWENKEISTIPRFLDDVKKANIILEQILNVTPTGLRTPNGYYCDLSDIPEMLQGLQELGLNYISSDLKSGESIEGYLTLDRQPHTYKNVGYPNIIEIPSAGWQDVIFTKDMAQRLLKREPDSPEAIFEHYTGLFKKAKELTDTSQVYICLTLHPWAITEYDQKLETHRRIINSARKDGINIISYGEIAQRIRLAS